MASRTGPSQVMSKKHLVMIGDELLKLRIAEVLEVMMEEDGGNGARKEEVVGLEILRAMVGHLRAKVRGITVKVSARPASLGTSTCNNAL